MCLQLATRVSEHVRKKVSPFVLDRPRRDIRPLPDDTLTTASKVPLSPPLSNFSSKDSYKTQARPPHLTYQMYQTLTHSTWEGRKLWTNIHIRFFLPGRTVTRFDIRVPDLLSPGSPTCPLQYVLDSSLRLSCVDPRKGVLSLLPRISRPSLSRR